MPTEEDARRLLAQAAATIEVDESAPLTLTGLPEPTGRRWPVVLVAAAAVLLAIGGGTLVAREIGPDDPDGTDPPTAGQPTNAPAEGEVVLDEDQVPGLIGYTREEASRLLQDRGYQVRVERQQSGCNTAGIVTGSAPPVGSRVDPGDTVTIRVVTPRAVTDCVGELPWDPVWDLVRLARGLDDAPASLAGAELAPGTAATLAHLVSRSWPGQASPRLRLSREIPPGCLGRDESAWDLWLWVEVPVDGIFCPTPLLGLRLDERGGVALVAVDGAATAPDDITEDELAASLERRSAASRFVAWARGQGPAPDFADRVRLLVPGFHSRWTDAPEHPGSYDGCSGLGYQDCPVNPVAAIASHEGRILPTTRDDACAGPSVEGRRGLRSGADVVWLTPPEAGSCPPWSVVLWIDAEGVVYGVGGGGA